MTYGLVGAALGTPLLEQGRPQAGRPRGPLLAPVARATTTLNCGARAEPGTSGAGAIPEPEVLRVFAGQGAVSAMPALPLTALTSGNDRSSRQPTVLRTAPETSAARPAKGPLTCGSAWWQVLGSNQRRLSRRFYSHLRCVP
jgi:hypothetical protein